MKNKFIPYEKLGKKARRKLNDEKRAVWAFDPTGRVVESKKVYNRKKRSRSRFDEYGTGSVLFLPYTQVNRNTSYPD